KTYCVNMTINCPYADPSVCGSYQIVGTAPVYPTTSLTFKDKVASTCGLSNGSYMLTIYPNTNKVEFKNIGITTVSQRPVFIENANWDDTIDYQRLKAPLSITLYVELKDGLTADAVERNIGEDDFMYKLILNDVETGDNVIFEHKI